LSRAAAIDAAAFWAALRAVLGHSGRPLALLKRSWGILGALLGYVGALWIRFGIDFWLIWVRFGCLKMDT